MNKSSKKVNFPKPNKSLIQLIGPSIVFVALSLNGGEMLLWPDLIGKYGLFILFIVPIILLFQFFVNIEIERYTITTKGNTSSKLIESVKFFKYLFPFLIIVSLGWPGWVSNSGNTLAYLLNIPQNGALISSLLMVGILLIWFSKRSYNIIENFSKIGLFIVLIISIYIVTDGFLNNERSLTTAINFVPNMEDNMLYVSALAFGGVTGVLNLVQSDWIINKKYGALETKNEINFDTEESKSNWNKWFRLINKEHFILFYLGNLIGIFLIALVAFFTIYSEKLKGFELLTFQIDKLGGVLGFLWGVGIILLFLMAQITIIDASGRLLGKTFKNINPSRLSQLFGMFGLLILIITIFKPEFNQPSALIQISAILSAAIMSIYPPLLLKINSRLPEYARPKLINRLMVILCSVFYLVCTMWILFSFISV